MNINYIYFMLDSFGIVRYVGEGKKNRYKVKNGRSDLYLKILENGGRIDIIETGLSKEESMRKENEYIEYYKSRGVVLLNRMKTSYPSVVSYELLSQWFELSDNSESGIVWKFDSPRARRVKAGFRAGNKTWGYYEVNLFRVRYAAHRVVWCLANKKDLPQHLVVNHIDGNPGNNSPDNLEAVSQSINILKSNRKKLTNSGHRNITLHERNGKLMDISATVKINGETLAKSFAVKKYGYDEALKMAIDYRDKIRLLIQQEKPF